jgi:hypothetical protein
MARRGEARLGGARLGEARRGWARLGMVTVSATRPSKTCRASVMSTTPTLKGYLPSHSIRSFAWQVALGYAQGRGFRAANPVNYFALFPLFLTKTH